MTQTYTPLAERAHELKWFGLRVPPQRERVAVAILERRNYFAATKVEMIQRRKTRYCKKRVETPHVVTHGYVFVGLRQRHELLPICNLHLVQSVVGVNGIAAEFNPVKLLSFLEVDPVEYPPYYKYMRTGKEFDPGDTVRVGVGTLRDQFMKVADIRDNEAIFLLPLLGREFEIKVDVTDCEPSTEKAA